MPTMIRYFADFRVLYDKENIRASRRRNVEVAFIVDRPKVWGIKNEDLMKEIDEVFRRFIAETTFTTFPEVYLGGGFERSEKSDVEANTFRLEIEYSDYDYDKHFDRVILIKNVQKLWEHRVDEETKEHQLFWNELSRQLRTIIEDELMWGKSRPKGVGGRPPGS